ncbi:MAG: LPS assembly lipoprotein LptE [Nitrospirota bacterium]|nr:LPS assembly lipoprotein LptE [Nitrospirota bacterium]
MSSERPVLPLTGSLVARWVQKILLLTVVCLVVGCGYRFGVEGPGPRIGGRAGLDDNRPLVRLIVRDFINRTFQSNLEFKYTRFIRQELTAVGGAQVVAEEAQADFLLKGEIVSVGTPSLTFTASQTREGRVNVVVRVTVEDRKTGRIVWGKTATGTGEFFINQVSGTGIGSDELQTNQVLQDRALEQAGQRLAESLADDFWIARDQGIFDNKAKPAPKPGRVVPTPGIS